MERIHLRKPIPAPYTSQVTDGTVLVDILNKAADRKVPTARYTDTDLTITRKYISLGVNQYTGTCKPDADSVTVFRLVKPDTSHEETEEKVER